MDFGFGTVPGINLGGEYYPPDSPQALAAHAEEARPIAEKSRLESVASASQKVEPVDVKSGNELRPVTWDDIVGQEGAKAILHLMVDTAKARGRRMDHMLFVAPAGTGKTSFAHVIANELDRKVYQLSAPISMDTLLELREVMEDGDILFLDEIHQQAIPDRRGKGASTEPEVLFSIMEDFTLPTSSGILAFPHITLIGATTDEGMLPDPFLDRFQIRPVLTLYTEDELAEIAKRSADKMGLYIGDEAARIFARAGRGVPRVVNNYLRNAESMVDFHVKPELALTVLHTLNGVTEDGLTRDMQNMLTFLYTKCRRVVRATNEVRYQASISSIATAIGKSRDQKAVALRIEPYLIRMGWVQVLHGGRALTDEGQMRAALLLRGE